MRYLSVFSGVEAATVAWQPLGWEPVAVAERARAAARVLKYRMPGVPNLGDVRGIRNRWLRRIGVEPQAIDVLVGGPPCQSFSVAGRRQGLDDPRGEMLWEFLEVARRTRPRWVVFENVPGLLSIDRGRVFGAFLGRLAELGYGFAYRVLDARGFGTPQRRRRVFVVGHSGGQWQRAAAVLFDRSCLRGRAPKVGPEGPGVAPLAATGSGGRGHRLDAESAAGGHVVSAITSSMGRRNGMPDSGERQGHIVAELLVGGDTAHTLRDSGFDASEDGTGRGTPIVAEAYSTSGAGWWRDGVGTPSAHDSKDFSNCGVVAFQDRNRGGNGSSLDVQDDCAYALTAPNGGGRRHELNIAQPVAFDPQGGGKQGRLGYREGSDTAPSLGTKKTPAVAEAIAFDLTQVTSPGNYSNPKHGDPCHPLASRARPPVVSYIVNAAESCAKQSHARESDTARCIDSTGSFANAQGGTIVSDAPRRLRRLTPLECERLQGLPDYWTLVPIRPVPAKAQAKARTLWQGGDDRFAEFDGVMHVVTADGPRYQMVGNSFAVPCISWIGRRIQMVEDLAP